MLLGNGMKFERICRIIRDWSWEQLSNLSPEGETYNRTRPFFLEEQETQPPGKHHEIYLSDPRKVPPGNWRTVIRQPVELKS